ncbi:hypothetical protein C5D18_01180 [Rathayibacter tritici]|nr:hypothetical protein C5D18_01180 [Rathayibacter tritici]
MLDVMSKDELRERLAEVVPVQDRQDRRRSALESVHTGARNQSSTVGHIGISLRDPRRYRRTERFGPITQRGKPCDDRPESRHDLIDDEVAVLVFRCPLQEDRRAGRRRGNADCKCFSIRVCVGSAVRCFGPSHLATEVRG